MLRFDPPELEERLSEAIRALTQITGHDITAFSDDIINPLEPGFSPSAYGEKTITPKTELEVYMPHCEFGGSMVRDYGEFIELARELQTAELRRRSECWAECRFLTQVEVTNRAAYEFIYNAVPEAETDEEDRLRRAYIELTRRADALRKDMHHLALAIEPGDELYEEKRGEFLQIAEQLQETNAKASAVRSKLSRPVERFFSSHIEIDGKSIVCSLARGMTMFGLLLLAEGLYSEYYPPATDDDLFVEICFDTAPSKEAIQNIVQAYLFELSSSLRIDLEVVSPPEYHSPDEGGTEDRRAPICRIRRLLLGKGMTEPLRLYNQAVTALQPEIQILLLTKAIEFVSQTVVRQSFTQTVRTKLLSPSALEPDAQFIGELAELMREQQRFWKDREAIKLTVKTCCDATELAPLVPAFISEFEPLSASSNQADRERALDKLGLCVADTRNAIAHAKANYSATGNECPENQIAEFAECVRLAAQQVIRWYGSQAEVVRVT